MRRVPLLWIAGVLAACEAAPPPPIAPAFTRVEVGEAVQVGSVSRGVAWGDFDGDGDPDLFVTHPSGDRTVREDLDVDRVHAVSEGEGP